MTKLLLSTFAGIATLTATMTVNAESYQLDPAHTYPYFSISHLGFSTMRGRFNNTTGNFTLDKAKGTGSMLTPSIPPLKNVTNICARRIFLTPRNFPK